jgi:TusA-related sulfurtransferase
MPIIELARAALDQPPGTRLLLLADDPAAAVDIAAWCRMRGNRLVTDGERAADSYVIEIVGAQPSGSRHTGSGA